MDDSTYRTVMGEIIVLGNLNGHQSGAIYSVNGIAPTIMAFTHGYAWGGA